MGVRSSQSRGPGLNETDGHLLEYFRNTFTGGGGAANSIPKGITASGGTTNNYTDGGVNYRSHTFNSTGTFDVSSLAVDLPDSVDILVVGGGGGGGGGYYCGAGGAGGVRTNLTGSAIQNAPTEYTASVGSFIVTVGGGGDGGPGTAAGTVGSASSITIGTGIVAAGGGHGGAGAIPPAVAYGHTGGSGGGGAYGSGASGPGTDAGTPTFQGYPGGTGAPTGGAGGGGAGGAGVAYVAAPPATYANNAGVGTEYNITGISSFYAAGGSGGGVSGTAGLTPRQSGIGGKGQRIHTGPGSAPTADLDALSNTGSGGGGCDKRNTSFTRAGNGSSGIVVVRYRI